jgi:hypothetical protein
MARYWRHRDQAAASAWALSQQVVDRPTLLWAPGILMKAVAPHLHRSLPDLRAQMPGPLYLDEPTSFARRLGPKSAPDKDRFAEPPTSEFLVARKIPRLYGRSGSYVTSYDGWHRNSDRHLRFEEDQLGIRAIVRWLGLADNTGRVPQILIAESMRDRAIDRRLSPGCPRKVFFAGVTLPIRGSFNVLPRKRSEVCGRFLLWLEQKEEAQRRRKI